MDFTTIKSNLQNKGFAVSAFATKEDAREYLCAQICGTSVGFGGSVSVEQMGLFDALACKNDASWHWRLTDGQTQADARLKSRAASVYIASLNALAESGELVNIDGTCNRVSETLYGHERVYFVVGRNKIAPTLEAAIHRARNVAAPLNARRLGRATPCAKGELKCWDCKSKERICKALCVMWEAPTGSRYEVILIDEDLGY